MLVPIFVLYNTCLFHVMHMCAMTVLRLASLKLQREAAWAICNAATGGTADHCRILLDYGFVAIICKALRSQEEPRLLLNLLSTIETLLMHESLRVGYDSKLKGLFRVIEKSGGFEEISLLREHRDLLLQTKAEDLFRSHADKFQRGTRPKAAEFRFRRVA